MNQNTEMRDFLRSVRESRQAKLADKRPDMKAIALRKRRNQREHVELAIDAILSAVGGAAWPTNHAQ